MTATRASARHALRIVAALGGNALLKRGIPTMFDPGRGLIGINVEISAAG